MGLFDKLFNKEDANKKMFVKDKVKWYLSQEAEKMYYSMSYNERINFIYEYLLMHVFLRRSIEYSAVIEPIIPLLRATQSAH